MKFLKILCLCLIASQLNAEQFSRDPHGLIGPKRSLASAWFFNEGGGTVANDLNGKSHGDLLSGPVWTTGLHGWGLDYSATNSRVETRNHDNFSFISSTGVWTGVIVFRAKKLLAGIILSKTGTFNSTKGFYIQSESDATGDFAFVRILAGATQKWVTPVIPLSQCCGNRWRVLIIDYCYEGASTPNTVKFFLDGTRLAVTGTPTIGITNNDNLLTISGWDDGTSASFNAQMDMVAIYKGDDVRPIALTEGDARAITARLLGR